MYAQQKQDKFIYLTAAIETMNTSKAPSYVGFSTSLNYHMNKKYALRAEGTLYLRDAVNLPSDFVTNDFFRLDLESISSIGVSVGRVFHLNSTGKSRFTLWLGLAYMNYKTFANFRKVDEVYDGVLTEVYDYDLQNNRTLGLVFKPTFELPFFRYVGVTLYPMIRIQNQSAYVGFGTGFMIGKLSNP